MRTESFLVYHPSHDLLCYDYRRKSQEALGYDAGVGRVEGINDRASYHHAICILRSSTLF